MIRYGFATEQQTVYDWLNTKLNLPVFAEAYRLAPRDTECCR